MSKKLVMISLDGLSYNDLELLRTLPNFSSLCQKGTLVEEVDSVFVSNTYPAHTSIITGVHPYQHGILDNTYFDCERKHALWRHDAREIKVPTLFTQAKKAGKSISTILYPVTGYGEIDWNLPELAGRMNIFTRIKRFFQMGTPSFLRSILRRQLKYLNGFDEPVLSNFATKLAVDTITRHKPDLLAVHLIDADRQKHLHGPTAPEVKESILRHDERLGEISKVLGEDTGLIVFSDHGCLAVHTRIDLEEFLVEWELKEKSQYSAFVHESGGTAFFQLLQPKKEQEFIAMKNALCRQEYVRRILTEEEMKISGMDQYFSFGVEAKGGYSFSKRYKGQHGYSLEQKNYKPFYLAIGEGIAENKIISGGSILDICPVAAELLGLPVWEMEGKNQVHDLSDRNAEEVLT